MSPEIDRRVAFLVAFLRLEGKTNCGKNLELERGRDGVGDEDARGWGW